MTSILPTGSFASAPNCIFCDATLNKDTKPEHILHNALGGRRTTRVVVCSKCNNVFGGSIDKALVQQVAVIRNLLQLRSGIGNNPPMLRAVRSGSERIHLKSDGSPDIASKPFLLSRSADGETELNIAARSFEEIKKLLPDMAAALRISEQELRARVVEAGAWKIERRLDPINFRLSLGGQDALRAATKACLVLWATLVGNGEIKGAPYEAVRNYIFHGNDIFNSTQVRLDSRNLAQAEKFTREFGPLLNIVYVRSNSCGRVIGHFTLYNIVAFQVVLAERDGSADQEILLASNPLDPSIWFNGAAENYSIPFRWLEEPVFESDDVRNRLSAIMKHYHDQALPKEIGRICDAVFSRFGLAGYEAIPQQVASKIIGELSSRAAKHLLRLPHEERLTPEDLRKIFERDP